MASMSELLDLKNIVLGSPCIFCDYKGPGYWQEGTHNKNCPWYKTGGETERRLRLRKVLRNKLGVTKYIGIVERNDTEGEIFGYYWEANAANKKGLQDLLAKYPKICLGKDWGQYEAILDPVSKKSLEVLSEKDENSYKPRVNYIKKTNWTSLINSAKLKLNPSYYDPLLTGKGLKTGSNNG